MAFEPRHLAAVGLFVFATTTRAEVVTLLCENPGTHESFALQVDHDAKTVADMHSDGTPGKAVPAKITEGDITWDHVFENIEVFKGRFGRFQFAGSVNRLSGQGSVTYWRMDTEQSAWTQTGLCSRAARKF